MVYLLYMPPKALVVYTPVTVLANAFLVGLNGLWLWAPLVLLGDLASALDGSLAKAAGTLLRDEALQEEAQKAAKAFVRLLVPFVRRFD